MLTDNPTAPLILVIEDDNNHALLIQRSFEDAHEEYRLERVGTIRAAKVATELHAPDLVLTDYQLPDGDGSELVALVAGACPVIMMTSHGSEQIAVETMKIGAQDYIVKSAEAFEALPRTVAQALKVWSLIQSRRQAGDRLYESEKRFRTLLDTIPDLIWLKDADGVYLSCNRVFERFFGAKEADIVGKTDYDFVDKDLADFFREHDCKAMAAGGPSSNEEWVTFADDGHSALLYTTKIPMFESGGTLIGVLGVGRDITDLNHAQEEKIKLESQLHQAQKMESIGNLAGGVAHDFNNKLCVILGHVYLAQNDSDPVQMHESLEQIRKAAEQSADLTRQLLAFARKQTIAPKTLDLNETISGMLKMLQRLIGEGIHLTWQPAPDLWLVKADPGQIDQILANLCVNARDAIKNTGRVTIETRNNIIDADYCENNPGAVPGEYVHFSVSDNGSGMESETMAHVFEPFYTTKGLGEGTGLGLATVYGIVKQNNGFIKIYSEPGQGTTFTVHLPRHEDKNSRPLIETKAAPLPKGQETILLVEDELAILQITAHLLGKQGYTVLTAETAVDAMRLAREHVGEISLLITDVIMPEMNGKELANKLLSLNPQLKCLYMSGYTADIIAQHGVLDDGMHFIQKPFSLPGLANKVREVLVG